MGTRVQVAASACFVVSGLFMCGLGGVLTFAERQPTAKNAGAGQINNVEGNSVHDSIRLVSGEDDAEDADGADKEPKTGSDDSDGNKPKVDDAKIDDNDGLRNQGQAEQDQQDEPELGQAALGDDDSGITATSGNTDPVTRTRQTEATQSPPIAVPPLPCEDRKECQTSTTPSTTTTRRGSPGPGGGGGSGGTGGGALPSGPPKPPPMQLPSEAPTIISAAPGVGGATGEGPTAPITLPVIVAPVIVAPAPVPALVPGLVAGGGGPAVPANPAMPAAPRGVIVEPPAAPRAVTAEPPAGRDPLPANIGNNPIVPAPNFRIGYTEYLRSAGIPQLAALAVPGIVGMLMLTAAGGLIGYRQAKAGHAVRTGVAERFVK